MDYKFTNEGVYLHIKIGKLIDKHVLIPAYILKEIYERYMKEA